MEKEEIHIRSEEVQEILSAVPNWMIRWGITLIFVLLAMLIAISWFIKYPDIIIGETILTTPHQPVRLVANNSGKIISLPKEDRVYVEEGTLLAEIENPVSKEGIAALQNYVNEVKEYLINEDERPQIHNPNLVFGEMQNAYNSIKNSLNDLENLWENKYNEKSVTNLKRKIKQYRHLIRITSNQIHLFEKELKNAEERYKANQSLHEDGFTSKVEFYEEESKYRQKQLDLENLRKVQAENAITLTNLEQDLEDIIFQQSEQKREIMNAINIHIQEIKNGIGNWRQNYAIIAPRSGSLLWLNRWYLNQHVENGQNLFAINSDEDEYIAIATIPAVGFGKVRTGQNARIRLSNYPAHEFGHLLGKVKAITDIPSEQVYQVEIQLSNGMTTSFNQELIYTPEISGQVEIVTKEYRLLQRVFHQFNQLFERTPIQARNAD